MSCKKKNILFSLLFAGVLLFCCSCATRNAAEKNKPRPYVWLTDSSKYTLLSPESIENSMNSYQLVSASYGGRDYVLNAWVKADETGMDMTLMNELGVNMGELSYNGRTVSFSSAVFPSAAAAYIAADFQLCFYDAPALGKALKDCGLSLEDTGTVRRVLQNKTAIIEIEKNRNIVKFINHLRGYSYTLEGDFE